MSIAVPASAGEVDRMHTEERPRWQRIALWVPRVGSWVAGGWWGGHHAFTTTEIVLLVLLCVALLRWQTWMERALACGWSRR